VKKTVIAPVLNAAKQAYGSVTKILDTAMFSIQVKPHNMGVW
jgi:hypothetical protein